MHNMVRLELHQLAFADFAWQGRNTHYFNRLFLVRAGEGEVRNHPGISAAVYCNGKRLGVFDKLANEINAEVEIAKEQKDSQNIYLGELDYEALMSCVEGELRYKPLSSYAPVKRDLALVCGEAVSCGEIEETIRKASPLVSEVKLFDIYRGANLGDGKKSMAFSLSLSDPKKEVSAEEVERVVKKILGNLKFKLGIEIR